MILDYSHWNLADRQAWATAWPNFTPEELACHGSGMLRLTDFFMNQLQTLRYGVGAPMHITSGCRTEQYNTLIGGKPGSFHLCDEPNRAGGDLGCMAVDVAALEGSYRGKLFTMAWTLGWSIGWNAASGFLHLDRRMDIGWRQTSFDY